MTDSEGETEMAGTIGMDVHRSRELNVVARDIDSFWTLQVESIDEHGNRFSVDLYATSEKDETSGKSKAFDRVLMQNWADALRLGADRVEDLMIRKCDCEHTDLTMSTVATCDKCGDKFDIFNAE
jgi:hypothetical protein